MNVLCIQIKFEQSSSMFDKIYQPIYDISGSRSDYFADCSSSTKVWQKKRLLYAAVNLKNLRHVISLNKLQVLGNNFYVWKAIGRRGFCKFYTHYDLVKLGRWNDIISDYRSSCR